MTKVIHPTELKIDNKNTTTLSQIYHHRNWNFKLNNRLKFEIPS